MALIKCHECGSEISSTAAKCPKCGVQPKSTYNTVVAVVAVLFLAGMGWFWFGGGLEAQTQKDLQGVHDQVAADSLAQYEIAKRGGDKTQICVQASVVAAAYLQAKKEPEYQRWQAQSKADCK